MRSGKRGLSTGLSKHEYSEERRSYHQSKNPEEEDALLEWTSSCAKTTAAPRTPPGRATPGARASRGLEPAKGIPGPWYSSTKGLGTRVPRGLVLEYQRVPRGLVLEYQGAWYSSTRGLVLEYQTDCAMTNLHARSAPPEAKGCERSEKGKVTGGRGGGRGGGRVYSSTRVSAWCSRPL